MIPLLGPLEVVNCLMTLVGPLKEGPLLYSGFETSED